MNKIYILAFIMLLSQRSWAQIREFQTTRLISTSGAGVASILATEAAILNPAASSFFNESNVSYQRLSTSLRNENELRDAANDDFASRNLSQGLFVSEHDGPLKGGFAYIDQDENGYSRTQIVTHVAAPLGNQNSFGVIYRYIQDSQKGGNETSHQMSLGSTHIIDDKTTLGLVLIDPTRTTINEERLLFGFQYVIGDRLTLIADAGAQYTKDVTDKNLWRAALQLQVFSDFFFRAGTFSDNIRESKGTSWGIGWIGPRLGIELAQKFSEQFGKDYYTYKDETLVDTSFSAFIKF